MAQSVYKLVVIGVAGYPFLAEDFCRKAARGTFMLESEPGKLVS